MKGGPTKRPPTILGKYPQKVKKNIARLMKKKETLKRRLKESGVVDQHVDGAAEQIYQQFCAS